MSVTHGVDHRVHFLFGVGDVVGVQGLEVPEQVLVLSLQGELEAGQLSLHHFGLS